jgi:hypothetical protein
VATVAQAAAVVLPSGAQELREIGRPPPSGSQSRVLPPPSGAQNPVLPPPSGFRYAPGTGGVWGDEAPRRLARPTPLPSPRDLQGDAFAGEGRDERAGELTRLDEIGPAIGCCWRPPPLPATVSGAMVTLRFSLTRDGEVFGVPRVTWQSTRQIGPDLVAALRQSATAAVAACAPLRLSRGLGQAIAGRPFSIRLHVRARSHQGPT